MHLAPDFTADAVRLLESRSVINTSMGNRSGDVATTTDARSIAEEHARTLKK
jgi:hypothetical protein